MIRKISLLVIVIASLCAISIEAILPQVIVAPGGGGGSTSITSGSTPIVGGADTQVCYNDGAVIACGDAGFTWQELTNALRVGEGVANEHAELFFSNTNVAGLRVGSAVSSLRLYSGSSSIVFQNQDGSANRGVMTAGGLWRVGDATTPTSTLEVAGLGLTASTMTAERSSAVRSATHSYTWTNAQVVALGAVTVGDINVATLPAKTRLKNAYVVIVTPDTSANALTVSCGDAVGGAPFSNYVLASDAKAAANTVYGDAVAERGTSIDVEWYYLPSYTATTLITCRFTKTTTNLDTVVGLTGRVILETELIP